MKFLKLKFNNARLIRERSDKNRLGYNRFFHPINKLHVYNSLCVLMDRTPKPQLRNTNDKFMPFYDDIWKSVSEGFIKIQLINENEIIITIKKSYNANSPIAYQYSWVDCKYSTGTLFPIFLSQVSEILGKSVEDIKDTAFDDVIQAIQNLGTKNEKDEIQHNNQKVIDLINWCNRNKSAVISNYLENKQEHSRPTQFGKRVYRGIADASTYEGFIYIPFSKELEDELVKYTSGHSTILDGGLVKIIGCSEVYEDDLIGFNKISEINSTMKFNKDIVRSIDWSDTIYNQIDITDIEKSVNKIIKTVGVNIVDNKKEYDSMIKNINAIKPKDLDISKVAYKLNFFIENAINKQYKYE